MKVTITTILLLLLFVEFSTANEEPSWIKSLTEGKNIQFHLEVKSADTTTTEFKDEDHYWINTKVLSKTNSGALMSARIVRIKSFSTLKIIGNNKLPWTSSFDTKQFDIPKDLNERIQKHLINKEFSFHISNSMDVSNVRIQEEVLQQILSNAGIKGIIEKHDALFETILNTEHLKSLLESIFIKNGANYPTSFLLSEIHFKKMKDIVTSLRIHTNFGKFEENRALPTIISGEFSAQYKHNFIHFQIGNEYPDRRDFDYKIEIDTLQQFSLKTELLRPLEFNAYLSVKNKNETFIVPGNFGQRLFPIEPGDSIHLNIDPDNKIKAYGKGAYKINLSNKLLSRDILDTSLPAEKALETTLANIEHKLQLIENSKDSLSEWAYNHLRTSVYFFEYNKLNHYFFQNVIYTGSNPIDVNLFNKLFSGINFSSYSSHNSLNFRRFLNRYIIWKQNITIQDINHNFYSEEESYVFTKGLLTGEARYFALAKIVFNALKKSKTPANLNIYEDFIKIFPNKALSNNLKNIINQYHPLNVGELATDFTLFDFNSQKVSLNDFKGKWIMLSFLDPNFDIFYSNTKIKSQYMAFHKLIEQLPVNRYQHLIILNNYNEINIDSLKKENNLEGAIFLKNDNWKNTELKPYLKTEYMNTFIINPQGVLEYAISGSPVEKNINKFQKYIQFSIDRENRIETKNSKGIIGFLGAIIILAALFFGIYKWRISIIKKREKRQREKLELEMQAVRSQLNPHFLFNSMNSIQHLVNADENEKANLFLSKFGVLMRKVLNQSELKLISLKEELETIETYLELEALRHHFNYSIDADKNIDIYTTEIPPMLLQPFVENAVVHGINGMKKEGEIIVRLQKNESQIVIQIMDNGKGFTNNIETTTGKGLQITKKRIQLMMENYKNEITFNVRNREENQTGTIAEIIFELEN